MSSRGPYGGEEMRKVRVGYRNICVYPSLGSQSHGIAKDAGPNFGRRRYADSGSSINMDDAHSHAGYVKWLQDTRYAILESRTDNE